LKDFIKLTQRDSKSLKYHLLLLYFRNNLYLISIFLPSKEKKANFSRLQNRDIGNIYKDLEAYPIYNPNHEATKRQIGSCGA